MKKLAPVVLERVRWAAGGDQMVVQHPPLGLPEICPWRGTLRNGALGVADGYPPPKHANNSWRSESCPSEQTHVGVEATSS